jgi:preprotein translocase subunit Sec63
LYIEFQETLNERINFAKILKKRRKIFLDKFEKIDKARKILELGEKASKDEIKKRYRNLMKKYHPDKASENRKYLRKIKDINWAYNIITSYCDEYEFSFKREDVERMDPELKLNRQFGDDWLMK